MHHLNFVLLGILLRKLLSVHGIEVLFLIIIVIVELQVILIWLLFLTKIYIWLELVLVLKLAAIFDILGLLVIMVYLVIILGYI